MNPNLKKITIIGMLTALAFVSVAMIKIPISSVDFLRYEPKDIIIAISGFIFGPLSALFISLVVSLIEMFTISTTGPIGMIMNVLASASFACLASFIYKKHKTIVGAIVGLVAGTLLMTIMMLLWNYLITPMYMGLHRDIIADMLIPVFLPFNLIKGWLNAAITLIIYKPLVSALRKGNLISQSEQVDKKNVIFSIIIGATILITVISFIAVYNGWI